MYCLFAVQISQPGQDMTSKIANNRFGHGTAAMVLDIFVDRTRVNIFQVYKETIIYLLHTNILQLLNTARVNSIVRLYECKERIYILECLDAED